MTRGRRRPAYPRSQEPGITARHDGQCARCDGEIVAGRTRIVFVRGRAIHVTCASGQDE